MRWDYNHVDAFETFQQYNEFKTQIKKQNKNPNKILK